MWLMTELQSILGDISGRTLKKNPRETPEFYRETVNNFIKIFEKTPSRREVEHLFDAV